MKALHAAGLNALDENKPQLAKGLFEKAVDKDPKNSESHYFLGKCYYLCDEYQLAIESLEQSIELKQRQLADIKKEINDTKGQNVCSEINTKLLELSKNIAYSFDLLAQCYIAQNKDDVALDCYNKAIDIYPNCESALHNLGILYMKFAKNNLTINLDECAASFDLAKIFIKRALEISSENPLFLQSVASWYEQYIKVLERADDDPQQIQQNIIRNFDYALHYYRKALAICVVESSLKDILLSNLIDCLAQYGHYFYKERQYEEAKIRYVSALELDPNHLAATNQMGMFYFKRDFFSDARYYFYSILQKTEDKQEHSDAWLNIACTYRMEQNWENAQAALRHARELLSDASEIIEEECKLNQSMTNKSKLQGILNSSLSPTLFSRLKPVVQGNENNTLEESNARFARQH